MKRITTMALLAMSFLALAQQKSKIQSTPFSTKDKTVIVYTTADSTKLRLTQTDK